MPCPLTPAQERLWVQERLDPAVPIYHEAEAVRWHGLLQLDVLEKALNVIVARHEALRTTVRVLGDRPVAIVHPHWLLKLKRIDLSTRAAEPRRAEVERLLVEEPRRPFRLEAEPGVRATVVQTSPAEHVLILMMHHLIGDRFSLGVLARELAVLYPALLRGQPSPLPPLPIQYGDYAAWQRQPIHEAGFAADLSFWKEELRGAPRLLELPADRPRPSVASYRGARRYFRLEPVLAEGLRELSRREQANLFTVFAAVFNILLYRYTGQEDLLVGMPIDRRDRPELQSLIGLLVDTQVLRTDLSGNPTFRELLRRVQQTMGDVDCHRAVPFAQVLEAVQPERDLSYSPLFQVLLNCRDREAPMQLQGLEGLAQEPLLAQTKTSRHDLTACLIDAGAAMELEIDYSTDLFNEDTVTRLVRHFKVLLRGIISAPDESATHIGQLPLLAPGERRQLLVAWNDTARACPSACGVHELFEAQVDRTPDAVAITCGPTRLTYAQLDRRANQLAHHLQSLGVGPEVLVAICLERSVELVVAVFGVLKAGGAYVPLDPALPKERLAYLLRDARCPVLLTQRHLLPELPRHEARTVCVDAPTAASAPERVAPCSSPGAAQRLAYVIYTSGSTGQPKGCQIEHASLVHYLTWANRYYFPDDQGGSFGLFTSLAFDLTVTSLFLPLLRGQTLWVCPQAARLDEVLRDNFNPGTAVDAVKLTPSHIALLPQLRLVPTKKIGVAVVGGEQLLAEHVKSLWALNPQMRIYNEYGPTEATVGCVVKAMAPGEDRILIGKPIDNTQVYVLDGHLQPVPVGVPGQLYLGGQGLARGYLNRPGMTAEKFIPHPFSRQPGARLYRTGDLVRWWPGGELEYLGRLDDQVKVRGFRIELGEVEATLGRHPAVRQALVLAREDRPGERRLVAYIVPNQGSKSSLPRDLRAFLGERLPDYMVPSAFVVLDALPLTANGKMDRRALPAPDSNRPDLAQDWVAPRTPLEELLTGIWRDVLGLERVGVHDNFFELGGHSLLGVKLISRVERALRRDLPLATLFQAPTVSRLAEVLQEKDWSPPWSPLVAIQPHGSRPPLFCVHGVGGEVLGYRDLSRHLGDDQPFYAFQAPAAKSGQELPWTIEEMAALYIQEMRSVQPRGPYCLGGLSFGGIVAFEMAQQLLAQGEEVALLAPFDTECPGHEKKLRGFPRVWHHGLKLAHLKPKDWPPYLWQKTGALTVHVTRALWAWVHSVSLWFGKPLPFLQAPTHIRNLMAAQSYLARLYQGRITLFRVEERLGGNARDPFLGWDAVAAGSVVVHDVPGEHGTLIDEPHVRLLAQRLRACLDEVAAQDRDGRAAAGP